MQNSTYLSQDHDSPQRLLVPLFSLTLFLSAVLLFWIQPLFSKMVLPRLGGAPAVWNTCMVFYQSLLFAGYTYAFLISRWPPFWQTVMHRILLVGSVFILPIHVAVEWTPQSLENPVPSLLWLLFTQLGLPFFLLSATAPLLQHWFHRTRHAQAEDPYFLYSASNAGSLGILLLYPFLIEPLFRVPHQIHIWSLLYGTLIALIWICAFISRKYRNNSVAIKSEEIDPIEESEISVLSQRLRWLILSLVPSSYLYGVTLYLTTDLAPVPLLWVVPLALYLLTFMLVFAQRQWISLQWMLNLQPAFILPVVLSLSWNAVFHLWILPLHLIAFFVSTYICHRQLADLRPRAERLTEYYLWLSFGGMLGGFFSALAAPMLFDSILEYPIMVVLACMLRPGPKTKRDLRESVWDVAIPGAVAFVLPGLVLLLEMNKAPWSYALLILLMLLVCWLCLRFRKRPLRFGLMVGTLVLVGILHNSGMQNVIYQERNFYGVLRVTLSPDHDYHLFIHGTTTHGAQSLIEEERREPLTYFHRGSPIAQIFDELFPVEETKVVAVVGLGAGTLAAFMNEGDLITFFEIDPAVEKVARNPSYFSYLQDSKAEVDVVLGDARLSLQSMQVQSYDLLVMDAFSSDAIPVHLVSREALQLYLSKLKHDGILLIQISNQYLDLEPVIGNLADDLGLISLTQRGESIDEEERRRYRYASDWVVLAREPGRLAPLMQDPRWQETKRDSRARVWTDDYSNILGVLNW